jgi:hypothetical protein
VACFRAPALYAPLAALAPAAPFEQPHHTPPPLRSRSLQRNALEGTLPAAWASAPRLQVLQLDDNRLSGALPAAGLPRAAREVGLRGNALEGGVPAGLAAANPALRCGALAGIGAGSSRMGLSQAAD